MKEIVMSKPADIIQLDPPITPFNPDTGPFPPRAFIVPNTVKPKVYKPLVPEQIVPLAPATSFRFPKIPVELGVAGGLLAATLIDKYLNDKK